MLKENLDWFFSFYPLKKPLENRTKHLENTMRITAINCYNASNRLKLKSKIAFATTIILSLGLILIPLIQMAKIPLTFNTDILSTMQIFLAVSVLVYSIIIGTGRYELRSEQLHDCGGKIKQLIREFQREQVIQNYFDCS
jgi:hypothetical protein